MSCYKCKECGATFKTERGLHIHLKVHGGLSYYYMKHEPRFDWWDGSPIEFSSLLQYRSSIFNSTKNRRKYYDTKVKPDVMKAISAEWDINPKTRNLSILPSETFFMLGGFCSIKDIRYAFGSARDFCKEKGLETIFDKNLPRDFWTQKCNDFEILVDTRERKPFEFPIIKSQKLSIGDYITAGEYFSKVSVDRKSESDFKGSFGAGFPRIQKNLKEARGLGWRLVYVVEATPRDMEKEARRRRWKTNFGYIYKNVRSALLQYPETQIIFCDNRSRAQDVTQRILYFGDDLARVDLQYFV